MKFLKLFLFFSNYYYIINNIKRFLPSFTTSSSSFSYQNKEENVNIRFAPHCSTRIFEPPDQPFRNTLRNTGSKLINIKRLT